MNPSDFIKRINSLPFPVLTVDMIIEYGAGIVMIKREYPPPGWALPGGFVEKGERVETAAVREAKEECGLEVEGLRLLGIYSDPARDERFHSVSAVFSGRGKGELCASSDARETGVFGRGELPGNIAFDHREIIEMYFRAKEKDQDISSSPPLS
jgi:ADP-ribose pyrophosphatase YjhB (NUDIX family)